MPPSSDPCLFALRASASFGQRLADAHAVSLSAHEEQTFDDGEHAARPLVNVRGRDTYVVQSLFDGPEQSVNDKLCRLLFFISTLRDAGAARITALAPYLGYARKDRRTQPRDPVTTRYVAQLLEAAGLDRIVTMDVHNRAAYQNAFRIPTVHRAAQPLFVDHFAERGAPSDPLVVVSPDIGGFQRADRFREALSEALTTDVPLAIAEKKRSAGDVTVAALVGDVAGRHAIIIDDMISTGTTLARAAAACHDAGATGVSAAATHGLFVGDAETTLTAADLDELVVTNTVFPVQLASTAARSMLTTLDAGPLFADLVDQLHHNEPITTSAP